MTYRVGKLPYAVLIDETGVVRAKGLINTREHLESLIQAKEMGVASIQQFLAKRAGSQGLDS
jgi:methylamine dehydrogenase accessory protein MauD